MIVITGASGGFGIEFARQLERRGHPLLLTGRNQQRLERSREALQSPQHHRLLQADLATSDGLEALLSAIGDAPLAGLVNNAGYGLWGGYAERQSDDHAALIATDLTAPMVLTHRLLPRLIETGGFVINVSSLAGESPLPWMASYSAAKAGLTFWSEALRIEQRGVVRVVTLAPGPSPTGFRAVSGMPDMLGGSLRTEPAKVVHHALTTLDAGGGFCVPGWHHRLLFLVQKLSPRAISMRLMHRYLAPR
ncbi:MAG: SDR family NAD(P)-dependent oxidoreductase [Mariprofundales bacterium]|nr:SDR family NAD(P)-dependent oxidoreductase [Mariprofundales bacterium]